MFRKAMFERGIRFCAFCRDTSEIARLEAAFGARFVQWMN